MTPVIRAVGFRLLPWPPMSEPLPAGSAIPGHDVLSLLAERGGHCSAPELRAAADRAFGPGAVYGNCHGNLFDFEGLLAFLESKGKLTRSGDALSLGRAPACSGHH